MIDPNHPLGSWFLLTTAMLFGFVYALPLLFIPLTWARWFRWKLPQEINLTVYLGRCLGAVALSIVLVGIHAAPDPKGNRVLFALIGCTCSLMTLIHIWGWVRRTDPWTEHAEIPLYAVVAGVSIWIHSTLG